jgi:hypothetical protein
MTGDDTHTYGNISREKVGAILDALAGDGALVTGDNPWTIDTRKHGVVLRGEWSEASSTLAVTVAAAAWYVSRGAIWETLDPLLRRLEEEG